MARSIVHSVVSTLMLLLLVAGAAAQSAKLKNVDLCNGADRSSAAALSRVVLVGDRGMLTQAQIRKLKQHPGLGWISALRGPAIRELVETSSLQLSLFDETNLAEITSPEYPGERLVACFNPLLAEERRRKRRELIEATEKDLAKIAAQVKRRTRTPLRETEIALKVGKISNRYKMAPFFYPTSSHKRAAMCWCGLGPAITILQV